VEESHDALGRVASVKHGGIALVKYEYDGNNNRLRMQDGRGVTTLTSYEYDKLNRVEITEQKLSGTGVTPQSLVM
jgi:YD repeat-containing protein